MQEPAAPAAPVALAESTEATESERRVTHLELFFDLVFVFAVTQVTHFLVEHPTPDGLVRGLFILSALWWAWTVYAWLTNALDPEEGAVRIAVFGAMGAMLVVSLAVPHAFDIDGVVFGVAYFVVRALHLVLFAIAVRHDPDAERAVLRMLPSSLIGASLLVVAGFVDGPAELALWVTALGVDYLWHIVGGMAGWRVSPEHFVERHALIIIVALGESVIAIGIGVGELALDARTIAVAVLGIGVVCALWWSYFDWVIYTSRARLADATGIERAVFARDLYSYLHLPLVAGIVLFAYGLESALAHGDAPLEAMAAVGLCGGLALYMGGHVALRFRTFGDIGHGRPLAAVVLVALVPVATQVPALAALALVAAVCAGLIAYEALRYPFARSWIRSHRGSLTFAEAQQIATIRGRKAATPGGRPTGDPEPGD